MMWLSDHWLGLTWTLLALAFLGWVVRKSRARSQRLFVDLPNERISHLVPNHISDHTKDSL